MMMKVILIEGDDLKAIEARIKEVIAEYFLQNIYSYSELQINTNVTTYSYSLHWYVYTLILRDK